MHPVTIQLDPNADPLPLMAMAIEPDARTIAGLAVPFGTPARTSAGFDGRPVVFDADAFTRSLAERADRVRMLMHHDRTRPVGRLVAHDQTPRYLHTTFRIARTRDGDEALELAAAGVADALSVGCDVLRWRPTGGGPDAPVLVLEAALHEVSLLPFPAFDSSRVDRVAAAAAEPPSLTLTRTRLAIARARLHLEGTDLR